MQRSRHGLVEAFTLTELIVIIAFAAFVGLIVVPAIQRARARAARVYCTNHLMQIGLAFKTWAIDHNDKDPMELSVTNGGTMEMTDGSRLVESFLTMSNRLKTPNILVCPADNRKPAARFDASFSNSNISYFVGLGATEETPEMFLFGDRNLTNGLPIRNGILLLPTNCPVGWTERMHRGQGNVGLADGSVQQMTSSRLWHQLCAGETATNRLMMP